MVTREDIEKELERLNEQLEIKISRVNILKQTLAEQTNELIAIAEEASMSEAVLNDLYLRAYKTVKFKVDSALGMVNTLSRLFSKKMQELNFSSQFDNSRLLME